MISVIESDGVLHAARGMNRRDASRLDNKGNVNTTAPSENEDDRIWADTEGVRGLMGASGRPLKKGGSYYSWGPYSRNRRILADAALAAGWNVEKARVLERRCVQKTAQHLKSVDRSGTMRMDLSDPDQPTHQGTPFTFQHVCWGDLVRFISSEVKEMDPSKMAAVKAAVLDCYSSSNKAIPGKTLPPCPPGETRISDALPVTKAVLQRAQDDLDKQARYSRATDMKFEDEYYVGPDEVKKDIKNFLSSNKDMSQAKFCEAIDVTEDELTTYLKERKEKSKLESKVFHNAPPFMNKILGNDGEASKRPVKKAAKKAARRVWVETKR